MAALVRIFILSFKREFIIPLKLQTMLTGKFMNMQWNKPVSYCFWIELEFFISYRDWNYHLFFDGRPPPHTLARSVQKNKGINIIFKMFSFMRDIFFCWGFLLCNVSLQGVSNHGSPRSPIHCNIKQWLFPYYPSLIIYTESLCYQLILQAPFSSSYATLLLSPIQGNLKFRRGFVRKRTKQPRLEF